VLCGKNHDRADVESLDFVKWMKVENIKTALPAGYGAVPVPVPVPGIVGGKIDSHYIEGVGLEAEVLLLSVAYHSDCGRNELRCVEDGEEKVEKVQDLEDEKTQVVGVNEFRDIEKAQYHEETQEDE